MALIEKEPEVDAPAPAQIPGDVTLTAKPPPVWRNRDFMLLWSGQLVSTLGSGVTMVVFPLLVLQMTNSPQIAGTVGALGAIPYLIFSLPAGALVDRWDRKKVMIICDSVRALNMLTVPLAIAFSFLTVWQLFVVALIEGTCFVWFNIAEVAALPRVVSKEQLSDATAQNQIGLTAGAVIAPSLGASLYQALGAALPFLADAISYAASVVSLFFIKTQFQAERAAADRHLWREIKEGVVWVWNQPMLRLLAFITGGLNLVGAGTPLMVIVLAKKMGADSAAIGLIFSIAAVGGIVGALLSSPITRRLSFGKAVAGTIWVQTLAYALFLFAPNYFVLGAIGAIIFVAIPIFNVAVLSYRLALIPDKLQGRVNSSYRMVVFGFIPIGSYAAGLLLERFGGGVTVVVATAVMVGLSLVTTFDTHIRNAPPIAKAEPV